MEDNGQEPKFTETIEIIRRKRGREKILKEIQGEGNLREDIVDKRQMKL